MRLRVLVEGETGRRIVKKFFVCGVLVLVFLPLVLIGCNSSEKPVSATAEAPTAESTDVPDLRDDNSRLALDRKRRYAFTLDGTELGYSKYKVKDETVQDGVKVFTVGADLWLDYGTTGCRDRTITGANLRIDENFNLISYQADYRTGDK